MTDHDKDARSLLSAIVAESQRQADLVTEWLMSIGFLPAAKARKNRIWSPSAEVLYKIAAMLKLRQWESAGLLPYVGSSFPSSDDVLDDIWIESGGETPRLAGTALWGDVLWTFLWHMAWTPIVDRHEEIAVVQQAPPEALLDELARFLWNHRHLAKGGED